MEENTDTTKANKILNTTKQGQAKNGELMNDEHRNYYNHDSHL
jgi:hypothetical protein